MSVFLKPTKHIQWVLLIFLFVYPGLLWPVQAADTMMSPQLYDLFQKKAFFDAAFSATDPSLLTDDQVKKLMGESIFIGSLPNVGVIVPQGKNYIIATGLSGVASGIVEKGSYDISMNTIDDICIVLPDNPVVIQKERENIPLFLQECKGKGKVLRQKDIVIKSVFSFQQISDWISSFWEKVKNFRNRNTVETTSQPASGFGTISGEKPSIVTITMINDTNKNGSQERLEKMVPWANVKATFNISVGTSK